MLSLYWLLVYSALPFSFEFKPTHQISDLCMHLSTVPLNCNFIFPRVILRGTTAIYNSSPLRVCVDHVYSCHVMYTSRGSTRVEIHVSWK